MKKVIVYLIIYHVFLNGYSKIWTVVNSGSTFSPASITITDGDTVKFTLSLVHDATEVSQATWDANGNTVLSGGFATPKGGGYILPSQLAVGTHYYVCSPHAGAGMKGTIIVEPCVAPNTPSAINGKTNVCSSSTMTYDVPVVSGVNSYIWSLPSGWSGTSTTNTISVLSGSTGGSISVSVQNNCGTSSASTLGVTVSGSALSKPDTIFGDSLICKNSTNIYSITPIPGADSYVWTLPNGWSGSSDSSLIEVQANFIGGTISVSAVDTCGSSEDQSLTISVVNVDTSATQEPSTQLITSNAVNATFQWIDCNDNSEIPNETSNTYGSDLGTFAVIVTQNNCIDTSACFTIYETGISDIKTIEVLIYPNPTSGIFLLEIENKMHFSNSTFVEIYDYQGKSVYNSLLKNNKTSLDLTDKSPGIYFVKVYDNGLISTNKIILK